MRNKISTYLSDISRIHHRAAFTDVKHHTNPKTSLFAKLVRKRSSCRKFSDAPVFDEEISQIIEVARLAPSAKNLQPVHVWVVRSPEAMEKLKTATTSLYGAPVVFMVGCKSEEAWVRECDGKNGAETDAAIVGTHILLQAKALKLGSVWVGSFDPAKIKEAFPETAGWEITALFPVGHPAKDATPSPMHDKRKSAEEFSSEL